MTTLEYAGTEQSLADWGFALESCQVRRPNLAASTFSGVIPGGSLADAPTFAFEAKVILRRMRTGSGTSWSGGYVAFIGYALPPQRSFHGESYAARWDFVNAWYFLQNIPFQQYRASKNLTSGTLEYKPLSELLLFKKLSVTNVLVSLNSGQQITEVLTHANTQAIAAGQTTILLVGNQDSDIDFPSFETKEMMCDEVILKCLQLSPEITCHFDYSTVSGGQPVPTIHFRSRANLTPTSLAVANGIDHRSLDIAPRNDLLVRTVSLFYKITGSYGGNQWVSFVQDKYGPHGANSPSDPDGGLRVLLQTLDLQGTITNLVECKGIVATPVDAAHATTATRLNWWKLKKPSLASDLITDLTIDAASVTVKNDAGAAVSLASFPNELNRAIPEWNEPGYQNKQVAITCKASWTQHADPAHNIPARKYKDREITVRMSISDAVSGDYSTTASIIAGETMPSGIAQKLYTALSVLQWQGQDVRVQSEISNALGTGPVVTLNNKLNLTGGHTAWATMNAQIQQLIEDEGSGQTSISFGPPRHLGAGDLAALFQFGRWRRVWMNPLLMQTAAVGDTAGTVDLSADALKENTSEGSGTHPSAGADWKFSE